MAIGLNGLFCVLVTTSSVVYFNSPPHPSPQSQLGTVAINLDLLDNRLTCEELQSAGMLHGLDPRQCDFSRDRSREHLNLQGFADQQFLGTLYHHRRQKVLWLHFFGRDIAAGRQRLDASLQALRTRHPGRDAAIRKVTGQEDYARLHEDWRW